MSDENGQQNNTEYKPTRTERKLIEVMIQPENRFKSVTELCEIAKCSRKAFYEAHKKPEFVKLVKEESRGLAYRYVLPTITAFGREAARGSHPHGVTILEMAGLVQKKGGLLDIDNPDGGSLTIIIGGKKIEAGEK